MNNPFSNNFLVLESTLPNPSLRSSQVSSFYLSIILSFDHFIFQSFYLSIILSFNHFIFRSFISFDHFIFRSFYLLIIISLDHFILRSFFSFFFFYFFKLVLFLQKLSFLNFKMNCIIHCARRVKLIKL